MGQLSPESAMVINAKHHIHTSMGSIGFACQEKENNNNNKKNNNDKKKNRARHCFGDDWLNMLTGDAVTNDYHSTTKPLTATTTDHSNHSLLLTLSNGI